MKIIQLMKKAVKRTKNLGFYLLVVSLLMAGTIIVDFFYDVANYKYRVPVIAVSLILITALVA